MTGTFLARKKLGSVLVDFDRGAHTPSTARTKQQHIALLNGHLLGETATLHIALAGSNMLVNPVDALNHHFILGGSVRSTRRDLVKSASLPVITATKSFLRIFIRTHSRKSRLSLGGTTVLYSPFPRKSGCYITSSARLVIFANFLSLSSRATAPKMRVPRGLSSLSMMTKAFRSKRI